MNKWFNKFKETNPGYFNKHNDNPKDIVWFMYQDMKEDSQKLLMDEFRQGAKETQEHETKLAYVNMDNAIHAALGGTCHDNQGLAANEKEIRDATDYFTIVYNTLNETQFMVKNAIAEEINNSPKRKQNTLKVACNKAVGTINDRMDELSRTQMLRRDAIRQIGAYRTEVRRGDDFADINFEGGIQK